MRILQSESYTKQIQKGLPGFPNARPLTNPRLHGQNRFSLTILPVVEGVDNRTICSFLNSYTPGSVKSSRKKTLTVKNFYWGRNTGIGWIMSGLVHFGWI